MLEPQFETLDLPFRAMSSEDIRAAEESVLLLSSEAPIAEAGTEARAAASLGQAGYGGVDEHSGTYSYGIDVFCPMPQNGAPAPRISVTYNSMASRSPSLIGAGWRLELGRIERLALQGGAVNFKNDQGSPNSNDHFVLEINGRNYNLAKVQNQAHRFRLKIEQSYAEAERVLSHRIDPKSQEPEIDYWDLYLADGTRLRYGIAGSAGEAEVAGELRNKVWNLISVENSYGQKIVYEYEAYKKNAAREMAYSYPVRVKIGVTPDNQFWDSTIEFLYSNESPPSQHAGYGKLDVNYTGRENDEGDSLLCILWRRLMEIRTLCRDESGALVPARSVRIAARLTAGLYCVEQVDEIGYKNGEIDAVLPPHRFTYTTKGESHPALMVAATTPLGKVEAVSYGLASDLDQGTPQAITGFYLVHTVTEQAGKESWTKEYRYWDGKLYTPFGEYRGHSRVDAINRETRQRTETYYQQTGILNGQVREKIVYDTLGRKVSHTQTTHRVLDYAGGRYLPFAQRTVTRDFAENGSTVLATLETVIPAVDHPDYPSELPKFPWGYAIDEFGNQLVQVTTIYDGDLIHGKVVRQKKTQATYHNVVQPDKIRLIGMLVDNKEFARTAPGDPWVLTEWIETHFNDKGQSISSDYHFDREDPSKVYRKSSEYDSETGKLTRVYRFNGERKELVDDTTYYNQGPYRFLISHVTNAKGQTEHRQRYDLRYRCPTRVVERGGMVVETDFDGLGRPTMELFTVHHTTMRRGAPKISVRYVYTVTPSERSIETINVHTGTRAKEFFDSLNRKFRAVGTGFRGQRVIETIDYDRRSRQVSRVSEPYYDGNSPAGFTTTEYGDSRLRTSRVTSPNGRVVRYEYEGLTIRMLEDVFERNADGTVGKLLATQLMDESTRDATGRLAKRAEGQAATRYEIYNTWDLDNRLVEVKDNRGAILRQREYGTRLDELAIATWDASLGRGTSEYDAFGRLKVSRQDFKGSLDRVTTLVYDELDRIVELSVEDLTGGARRVVRTSYDRQPFGTGAVAREEVVETNSLGKYVRSEEFEYDEFGNPTGKTLDWFIHWPGLGIEKSIRLATKLQYDGEKGGRLERLSYPTIEGLDGGTVTCEYEDLSGYLTSVRFNGESVWKAGGSGYNARGGVIETDFGNGVSTRYDYDPQTGLVNRSMTFRGSTPLLDQRLVFDTAGNVRQRDVDAVMLDASGSEKPVARRGRYLYDDKNELVEVIEDQQRQSFVYRCDGSRLRFAENEAETLYHYDGQSPHQVTQLTGAQDRRLMYDNAGNVVHEVNGNTNTACRFAWSPSNRLHNLQVVDNEESSLRGLYYGYSSDNDRTFLYDNLTDRLVLYGDDQYEVEWRRADDRLILRSHLSNGARRFATVEQEKGQSPRIFYWHRDQLQSVTLVTGGQGEIACTVGYEAFGRVTEQTGPHQPDLLFTGQRAELVDYEGFSFYDFRARWYDPVLGCFLAPDPTDDGKNIAFGFNRYAYVGNCPLSNVDPRGLDVEKLKEIWMIGASIHRDDWEIGEKIWGGGNAIKEYNLIRWISTEDDLRKALAEAHHPIFVEHGSYFHKNWDIKKIGKWSAEAGNDSLTFMVCGGLKGNSAELFNAGTLDAASKGGPAPLLYGSTRKVQVREGGVFSHGPAPVQDANGKVALEYKNVDLAKRFEGAPNSQVFTDEKFTKNSKILLETNGPSFGQTSLKVTKAIGGPLIKGLDVYGRVQDGMEIAQEIHNGNYAEATKKTAVAAMDYVPSPHVQAFMTGYHIGDAINKLTNNYIPNKIADALVSVGADKVLAKASDIVSKVTKWFKSWW